MVLLAAVVVDASVCDEAVDMMLAVLSATVSVALLEVRVVAVAAVGAAEVAVKVDALGAVVERVDVGLVPVVLLTVLVVITVLVKLVLVMRK